MKHFQSEHAAGLYAKGRPFFHDSIVERIARVLGSALPVCTALDVACGTGLSSSPLKSVASCIVGIDVSMAMLRHAPRDENLHYVAGAAESLPIADGRVGLMTISSAFHWFDQKRFLAEARRVRSKGGWLVNYDNCFRNWMAELPTFSDWYREVYLPRYPSPPRQPDYLEEKAAGFACHGRETYENVVAMSSDQLVLYLLTQSNTTAPVEAGRESVDSIRAWLENEIRRKFDSIPCGEGSVGHLKFGGAIWYLRRT